MSQAIQKVIDRAQSYRASLARVREKARVSEERTLGGVTALTAAAVAGYADGKLGEGGEGAQVLGIPAVPVIGGIALLAGLSDMVPGGMYLCMAGIGPLSYAVGTFARNKATD